MKEERLLPIGTQVFDVRYGWGKVEYCEYDTNYPIRIGFVNKEYEHYALNGMLYYDRVPMLSLTEYSLENGGFTPISEYWNKPQIGDWGYFWDREDSNNVALFGRIACIETRGFEEENSGRWRHFSHEIPDHIKKQMHQ